MKYTLLLFAVLLVAPPALADERLYLPNIPVTTVNNKPMVCADVEQWRAMLLVASEYNRLYDLNATNEGTMADYQLMTQTYDQRVAGLKDMVATLTTERDYLRVRVNEEHVYNLKLNDSIKMNALGWKITAGTELAAIIALSIVSSVFAASK